QKGIDVSRSRVLLLGFAFKENCPDTRNTKVAKIYEELVSYGIEVDVYDPWVNVEGVRDEYGVKVMTTEEKLKEHRFLRTDHRYGVMPSSYNAVLLMTAHKEFNDLDVRSFINEPGIVYDAKAILNRDVVDGRL
ncbi:MAG: UDP binding domain-containing protein, partial [Flavobacterium sp.]